jgi:putative nucleotidyltransferase with HDIG domain
MNRVLFVDDEPRILRGLKRMLLRQVDSWDMSFATSAAEALELLERERFDVIISDMRMPRMDGARLLGEVQARYPYMVRIILSGNSDMDMIMRSVKPAHRFLAKPCDSPALVEVLNQAAMLSGFLQDEALASLVGRTDALPSMPEIYRELMRELERTDSSLERLGQIVAQDMGLSTTALKLVNSSFFGLRRSISSPVAAVRMLGLDVVKGLAVSVQLFSEFDLSKVPGVSFETLWQHCLNTGGIAKGIAQHEGMAKNLVDECFNAGLLHDVGKLVLAAGSPDDYNRIIKTVRAESRPVHEVEYEMFGTSHAEICAYLLTLWGIDESIVRAAANHHRPRAQASREIDSLALVHSANFLEHQVWVLNKSYVKRRLDRDYLKEVGAGDKFRKWLEIAKELVVGGDNDEQDLD